MILDCTIRDSGYLNNWQWTYETVKNFVYYMGEIGLEYCEIGFIMDNKFTEKNDGIWRHINDDFSLIGKLKKETETKTKIAVMFDIGTENELYYNYTDIPDQFETQIDLIRVCCYYKIINKVSKICWYLKKKGYNLSLNIMYASQLEKHEQQNILTIVKKLPINYLYFADSIGALTQCEIKEFVMNFKNICPIQLGFHNHDNNGTVFGNVITLLDNNIDIVDATISGFGKNGGNCNLEQLLIYLVIKKKYKLDYDIHKLFDFLEIIKDVDFGNGNKICVNKIQNMIQQFCNVHNSLLMPLKKEKLGVIYDKLCCLKSSMVIGKFNNPSSHFINIS